MKSEESESAKPPHLFKTIESEKISTSPLGKSPFGALLNKGDQLIHKMGTN
jgi:hypothetical protein